jgi:hypothetical protein
MPGTPPVKRRMYPTKQIAVAEMRIKLEQTRALFLRSLGEARVDPSKDERLRCYAAHYTIMENANDICRLAVRTCGGRSIMKSMPLERLYRDSRCGSLMLPWTAEICVERLGRDGEVLPQAGEIHEAQVNRLDFLFADQGEYFFGCHGKGLHKGLTGFWNKDGNEAIPAAPA